MADIKLLLTLSENWTLIDPRDLPGQVQMAVAAEQAGFDGVIISDHIVLGQGADSNGEPFNIREFVGPGTQHPSTAWPSNIVLMSGIAARTSRIRILSTAMIAPLRHPLLLAKELATLDLLAQGRLVVLPTVSWHESEYKALQVPFRRRGRILDEQLKAMRTVWAGSPASFRGDFYEFENVWLEPGPYRAGGPTLWFGGGAVNDNMLRRLVEYGSGFMGTGPTSPEDLARIADAMTAAGRDMSELEFIGGLVGRFESPDSIADLDGALSTLERQLVGGIRSFVIKPSQFLDDLPRLPEFLAEVVEKTSHIAERF
ncbi:MAG: TIGR03619 family F420-dependent LLM class oxidoreductase [Gammaproteobacteria bacterium]|nr:TIGR03619 family F420-dependent LLM class oxidoreductase [Gammaproteobacteria bacterium]